MQSRLDCQLQPNTFSPISGRIPPSSLSCNRAVSPQTCGAFLLEAFQTGQDQKMPYGLLSVTGVTEERSEKQLWVTLVTDSDRSFVGYCMAPNGSQEVTRREPSSPK